MDAQPSLVSSTRPLSGVAESDVASLTPPSVARPEPAADHLPLIFAVLDRDLRYRFVNACHEALVGVPRAQALGRRVDEVLSAEAARVVIPRLERALRGEVVVGHRAAAMRWERKWETARMVSSGLTPVAVGSALPSTT